MKKDPLNRRLLDAFPQLKEVYPKVKDGCFDLDTPSNAFFSEVFVPYVICCIQKEERKEVEHCFSFIEEMMNDEDEHTQDIAMSSVLIPLFERGVDFSLLPLGEKSRRYSSDWISIQG